MNDVFQDSPIIVVGITHRDVGLEEREMRAVAREEIGPFCRSIIDANILTEAVVLSTCNRVELYGVPPEAGDLQTTANAMKEHLGVTALPTFTFTGKQALEHLFHVSASLDSMVVGEPQILGQIKEAFALAKEANTVGTVLSQSFTRAFRAARRVRRETTIARSALSVGHVAVELAKTIFGDLTDISVLLVGAGKMGILAAENLSQSGAEKVLVVNRTHERGQSLADRHGWSAAEYGDFPQLMSEVDVVICSTGSPKPVLTTQMLKETIKKRRYRNLFLIDIAVPRDIEAGCGALSNVYLYNIDDLEAASQTNAHGRQAAVKEAERLLSLELTEYSKKVVLRKADPAIQALRSRLQDIATAECTKALKRIDSLSDTDRATVRKMAEVIAERIARYPLQALKNGALASEDDPMVNAVCHIFELNGDTNVDDNE